MLNFFTGKVTFEQFVGLPLLTVATTSLIWLMLAEPNYKFTEQRYNGPCPGIYGENSTWTESGLSETNPQRKVNCKKVLFGKRRELLYAASLNFCQRKQLNDQSYLKILDQGCDHFVNTFGYNKTMATTKEKDFPIAFSILTYEDIEQTERLLRAIYQKHNVYCVHVDAKAPSSMLAVFTKISECLPNIIVPSSPVTVYWAEYSVLEAELLCMKTLWESVFKWKYYINLTGREFPLRTNAELVDILEIYNGANDIDGSWYHRNPDWMKYVWRNEYWRTNTEKGPVPHNFNIFKGSAHIVASRNFVDYVLNNQNAKDLREWMKDTRLPDEHYFNTLNNNARFNISGAFKGDPENKQFVARYKIWQKDSSSECSGQWSRYVCNLGVRELPTIAIQKHLFVNKLHMDVSSTAFKCLEQWHYNRSIGITRWTLDRSFYRQLSFVRSHV